MAKTQIAAAGVQDTAAAETKNAELSPAVAEKYKLQGIKPGRYHFPKFGEVDLTSISLAKADNLVKRGFSYLQVKNKKAEDTAAAESADPDTITS